MGDYSFLYIHPLQENQTETKLSLDIQTKYTIPLFWIALFKTEDLQQYEEYEDEETCFYYQFEACVEDCISNFQQRLAVWPILIQSDYILPLADKFLIFLRQFQGQKVILNLNDIIDMYSSAYNQEALAELTDISSFLDHYLQHPQQPIPFKHWLSHPISLENPKDRYEIDGLGCELLPYPALDAYLEQQKEKISPIIKTEPTEHIKEEVRSQPKQNTTTQKSNPMYGYGLAIVIILILMFYFNH